jgi:YggT family protein
MILDLLGRLINFSANILILIIFLDIILSYFLSPFHKIRLLLDKIVQPMLTPIRKIIPPIANFDFSPMILIVLIEIISYLLIRVLSSF